MKKQLTKQELKDRQEKKQRILKFVKRSINIVCYVLSALFLILCVAVGVNSCSKKSNSSSLSADRLNKNYNALVMPSINFDSGYLYTAKYSGTQELTYGMQTPLLNQYDCNVNNSNTQLSNRVRETSLNGFQILINNEFKSLQKVRLTFTQYQYIDTTVKYRYLLGSVVYYLTDDTQTTFVSRNDNNSMLYTFSNDVGGRILYNGTYFSNSFFALMYDIEELTDTTTLTFGDTFNYNAGFQYLVALDVNNTGYQTISENLSYYVFRQYDGYITTTLNASSYQLTLDLPYFYSNGFLFNQIVFNYVALANTEQVMTLNNGFVPNHYVNQQNTTLIYHSMRYKNSINGLSLQTNIRNGGLDSSGVYYWQLTTSWANDNYKTITFFNPLNEYETYFLNNMNNLTLGGNLSSGGSVFDVFTLLANGFKSLTSLLNVAILPSITIGALLSIPLVVSLIILIFKLIKR